MDPRITQNFGGVKIMVWGYIQYGGVREICRVEGNINSLKYQQVLAASYIPNHKRGQILQQDGAPSHTSISTSKFLKEKKIKVLQDWPTQSPDMNIIEHVWGRMKEEAWKTKPKNLDELWEACKTAFFAIPDDFINKLYESLLNRMDAVLQGLFGLFGLVLPLPSKSECCYFPVINALKNCQFMTIQRIDSHREISMPIRFNQYLSPYLNLKYTV